MRKIIIEVPENCNGCEDFSNTNENCKRYGSGLKTEGMYYVRCPDCVAAEVDNLFNKHLENVLKEETGK